MEAEPAQAIMVGDWEERDIRGARNIGMTTAFARYGDLFNTGISAADYDLKDISELVEIIRPLREESA
jgi:FMN phosphatase YigB (HAD superfamily)